MANDILAAIKATYLNLDACFGDLIGKCATEAQKARLRSLYTSARDNFFAAEAQALTNNNSSVDKLKKQLQDANTQVQAQLDDFQDIVAALKLITEAVALAASLATLAAAA
ncbi:MAG: hypothetical protein ACREQD_03570 [Candidatus Binataceae bacterium]